MSEKTYNSASSIAKTQFKVGDLVTITEFSPDSAWQNDIHLIGIVYEITSLDEINTILVPLFGISRFDTVCLMR